MNRKKVRYISDLPKWFDIHDYDVLEDLKKDEALIYSLVVHRLKHYQYQKQSTAQQVLPSWITNQKRRFDPHFIRFHICGNSLREETRLQFLEIARQWAEKEPPRGLSVSPSEMDEADLKLYVNLKSYTDAYILKEMARLLPLWRRRLGIKAPIKPNASKENTKNIIRYRVIPYLDLLIWAECEQAELTQKIIELGLFGDRKQTPSFYRTFKPFMRDILEGDFLDKWMPEIDRVRIDHYGAMSAPRPETKASFTPPDGK